MKTNFSRFKEVLKKLETEDEKVGLVDMVIELLTDMREGGQITPFQLSEMFSELTEVLNGELYETKK